MGSVPVAAVEYAYGVILFLGQTAEEADEAALVVNLGAPGLECHW